MSKETLELIHPSSQSAPHISDEDLDSIFEIYRMRGNISLLVEHLDSPYLSFWLVDKIALESKELFEMLFLRMIKTKSESDVLLFSITDELFIQKWEERNKVSYYEFLNSLVCTPVLRNKFYQAAKRTGDLTSWFLYDLLWIDEKTPRKTELGTYLLRSITRSKLPPLEILKAIGGDDAKPWGKPENCFLILEAQSTDGGINVIHALICYLIEERKEEQCRKEVFHPDEKPIEIILECMRRVYPFVKDDYARYKSFSQGVQLLDREVLSKEGNTHLLKGFHFNNPKQGEFPLDG